MGNPFNKYGPKLLTVVLCWVFLFGLFGMPKFLLVMLKDDAADVATKIALEFNIEPDLPICDIWGDSEDESSHNAEDDSGFDVSAPPVKVTSMKMAMKMAMKKMGMKKAKTNSMKSA